MCVWPGDYSCVVVATVVGLVLCSMVGCVVGCLGFSQEHRTVLKGLRSDSKVELFARLRS